MDFEQLCKDRYSVRKFSSKQIPDELLKKVLEVGNTAPSAKNQNPVRLIICKSDDALSKAKEIRRPAEKLITLAKRGDLASRRLVIARLDDTEMGNYLVDVIAPQVKHDSGYLRIERNGFRVGDNTEMATISFVDDIKDMPKPAKKAATKAAPKAEKKADKKEEK